MRILTIATGILFVITSVWCFAHPGGTFLSLAFLLGVVMILQGISGIFAYRVVKKKMNHAGYFLSEAILTIILGVIVLSNQLSTDAMIPMFFGMWIIFTGIMRIVQSLHMDRKESKTWIWILGLGIISTLAGIYAFFNPILAGITVVMLIAISFLLQGINVIITGVEMPKREMKK